MKNWNKTAKIKAIVLVVLMIPSIIFPIAYSTGGGISALLTPLIFGSIAIPLIAKFNQSVMGFEISKPTWNDKISFQKPLVFFHTFAIFFIFSGITLLIGTAVKFQRYNEIGLEIIAFGIGILIGIKLTLMWTKKT